MSSFDDINFSIRPNKNVERKLIFETLVALDSQFPFGGYRYIGFGSLWFADFVLGHRMLGIHEMTSIQEGEKPAMRAKFNSPYKCITVIEGDAATVLPTLPVERAPSLLWLDYEDPPDRLLTELEDLCARLSSGSVLIVTANAEKERVTVEREADRRARQEESFRQRYGVLAPPVFSADYFDNGKFQPNIAQVLLNHLKRATRVSGREERFIPLLNFTYRDNARMITVGGMVANGVDQARLSRAGLVGRFPWSNPDTQTVIAVPPLTTREKFALDKWFPTDVNVTETALEAIGLPLKQAQIDAYQKYYMRYPIFGEMLP